MCIKLWQRRSGYKVKRLRGKKGKRGGGEGGGKGGRKEEGRRGKVTHKPTDL